MNFSERIIYLSIKEQNKLNYKIIKYLNFNSYSRKNIGYLYAIYHGAKEIYEIDEEIIISNFTEFDLNNKFISYGKNNYSEMINPYFYFGEKSIWPRGFRINDIGKQGNNKFYISDYNTINLRPLVLQGIINGIPDIDSILFQTALTKIEAINFNFFHSLPLLYQPGNYIPINSKNTRYLYDIFPFLCLPTTINEEISDILRGYIIQRFAWGYNGAVYYIQSNVYRYETNSLNSLKFIKEKNLFYKLDYLFNILNSQIDVKIDNPFELLLYFVRNLIKVGILGEKDLTVYKAFLNDLRYSKYYNIYKFNKEIDFENKSSKIYSELNEYIAPFSDIIIRKTYKTFKIINHYISKKLFKDILLIINYKHNIYCEKLISFIISLYRQNFNNIIFVVHNKTKNNHNINFTHCEHSKSSSYLYSCFKQIFKKYPKFKGYLFINNNADMKILELENLNFNIPWFYCLNGLKDRIGNNCKKISNLLKVKRNIIKIKDDFDAISTNSDFYYIPSQLAVGFLKTNRMFKSKAKTQLIIAKALWADKLKNIIKDIKKNYNEIIAYPIKYIDILYKLEINLNQHLYFSNSNNY